MIVDELGAFVARMRAETVPAAVASAVKIRMLDVLASAFVGFELGNHRMLLPLIGEGGTATLWGEGRRASPRDAALVNSFLAHSTYLEDGSRHTGGHPSSGVIPAAMALAESCGMTGRDLVAAIAVGYEIFLRMGRAIFPTTVVRGFQSTAVLAAVGSAAACANLLRLDEKGCRNALAIACNLGVGLKEALKSPGSQPLQVGRSCEGGLFAALFAREGAVGADRIIENGFVKAFSGHEPDAVPLAGLGTQWSIDETYFKLHGGCRGTHAPVDAVQALAAEQRIAAEDIESMTIGIGSVTLANDVHHPRTGSEAQFSAAFAAAVALVRGSASTFEFSEANLADPAVRSLMDRIRVRADPELDAVFPAKRGASVEIVTRDGRRYAKRIDGARGEPEFPIQASEIEKKFLDLSTSVLGENAERVRELVLAVDSMPSLTPLVELLARPSRHAAAS